MSLPIFELDHIVVAAHTLDQGAAYVQRRVGVEPSGGGKHAAMGTHNRVLKLGRGRYLEVIAIDPDGQPPGFPRWFHLDDPILQARLKIRPRLIAWVVRTDAADAPAASIYGKPACVRPMRRDTLRWQFAFTKDGSLPGDGLIPHIIHWEGDRHPADLMTDAGCALGSLDGAHGNPASVQRAIASMGLDNAITIHPVSGRQPPGLLARIKTPAGMVVLD